MHLLVDSTGLKLCGKGEWLLEKHGPATRRSWRMLHLGVDAGTGRIVASTLDPQEHGRRVPSRSLARSDCRTSSVVHSPRRLRSRG
ncbi:MAG: transposase, partial [Janthinobacterium lividum]